MKMPVKILIIEDQSNNMRLIEQIIEDIDDEILVSTATTGEKALLLAKDTIFDLVLSDISLPDMDGMMISEKIKSYSGYEMTPFIAVTAYAGLNDEGKFRQYFEDYISKPIDEDLLIVKIKKWLGDKLHE
jgi:Response regulator containing CheY-like receiver, AAA-type ATPase, and DNA-binding domains